MIRIRLKNGQLLLPVRVTPRGGRDCLMPFAPGDAEIRLKVAAPPEDGKANDAVVRLLAAVLGVPKAQVRVAQGDTSRNKRIAIDPGEADGRIMLARLAEALQSASDKCFEVGG